ncbi:MAG TPA: phytoene/squalene synthase family protein [Gemmatimonadaceae bacterium]|nr:phytoene/squalene synthase family protein [Gemmatimonadaceae bacterium]
MIQTIDDARLCARITRRHARTFSLASRFLAPEKRRAAFAVYAFCRTADDIVDRGVPGGANARRVLDEYRAALDDALDGRPEGPVFRELARAVDRYRIPTGVLHDLLDGVARDLQGAARFASWAELACYCEGVASTVGEMCTYVFGVEGSGEVVERAVRYGRTLGMAMQLTNILRDVGEDAARGRCYLPADELAAFGLRPADVLGGGAGLARDERWRPLMAFQIGRARALYEAAAPGLSLLAADARRCAVACAQGYAAILTAIEAQDYDTLTRRASVPPLRRAMLLYRIWRHRDGDRAPSPCGGGPFFHWEGSALAPGTARWA